LVSDVDLDFGCGPRFPMGCGTIPAEGARCQSQYTDVGLTV